MARYSQCRLRVSLIDRLVHNAEIVMIEGESYRLKAHDPTEQRPAGAAPPAMTKPPDTTTLPAHLRVAAHR